MLTCFSAGDREPSTNQLLFMQNKPNFRKSQMNLKFCKQMAYENKRDWTIGQNKPNSNPTCSELVEPISNEASTHGQQELQKIFDFAVGGR
jgi:hypothetical protein